MWWAFCLPTHKIYQLETKDNFMRSKIFILFLFSALIPSHFSFAFGTSIGTQSNPIYIQVQQDPTQLWQNAWDKINSMQYVAACSGTYNSVKSLATKNGFGNVADPATAKTEASYLNYLYSSYQLCINHVAQTQSQQSIPSAPTTTTTGNILDTVCQKSSGANSFYSGETDVSKGGGMGGCSCKAGFQFEHGNYGQCVTIPAKTNGSILPPGCSSTLYFSATTGISCNGTNKCGAGSQFNSDKTECIPIQKATTPTTKKVLEVKTAPSTVKANTANVATPDPVNLNQAVTTSTTTEVKLKNLWQKIIGWLGF